MAALQNARLPRSTGLGEEVLDEDFFMYKEDVDLAWRLRLLGWWTAYEPRAVAWHARTASGPTGNDWRAIASRNRATPAWIRELSWRNQRLMQLKNERPDNLLRDLPWIWRREVLSLAYIALADTPRLSAVAALARAAPGALAKRKALWARIATNRNRTRTRATPQPRTRLAPIRLRGARGE
jgi:GT2 family glycosyltransferase